MMPMPAQSRFCAVCIATLAAWEATHQAEVQAMTEAMRAAAAEGRPVAPASAVPDGMPRLQPSVTSVGGTEYCLGHVPGMQGAPGRGGLLVAQGALSPTAMAAMGRG